MKANGRNQNRTGLHGKNTSGTGQVLALQHCEWQTQKVLGLKNWVSLHLHQQGRQEMGSRCSENVRITERTSEGFVF